MTFHPRTAGRGAPRCGSTRTTGWTSTSSRPGSATWRRTICGHYLADYQRRPTKPYLDGETRYENSHRNFSLPRPMGPKITAYHVRQAAYYAMLCGAAGHTYGCATCGASTSPRSARPRAASTCTGARPCTSRGPPAPALAGLFERYPWHRLVPDADEAGGQGAEGGVEPAGRAGCGGQPGGARREARWEQAFGQGVGRGRLITHGAWDGTANLSTPAAIADDGSFALIYLPSRCRCGSTSIRSAGRALLWTPCGSTPHRRGALRGPLRAGSEGREARLFPPETSRPRTGCWCCAP